MLLPFLGFSFRHYSNKAHDWNEINWIARTPIVEDPSDTKLQVTLPYVLSSISFFRASIQGLIFASSQALGHGSTW
jgi:hypothetical protein